ncbi:MAG: TetR/AcrR family transcriptional regulator, partial [Chitinophagaceae bacterium]|nr:TetR/AcrR family transcriptional regulator [Chitinophagaceae bacterium]
MRTRDVNKEAIVKEKAIELLVKDGFENFSVNKLARACGISVATLYIYYKDKDDLIVQIAREEFLKMSDSVMKDFDTASSFEAGLRYQWRKRSAYLLATPYSMLFFDQLKSSSYQLKIYES